MATDGPMNDNVVNPLFGKVAPADVHAAISYLAEDMIITEEEEQELRQALFINKYGESFSSSTTPDEAALNLNIDAARAAWKNTNLEGSPSSENNINIDGHMYTAQNVIKAYIDYAIQMQNNQGGNNNMANVMFKRGTQAALNTLMSGSGNRFADGCFYLTTDTDRLYVAQSASELVELNKSITKIDTLADLHKFTELDTEVGQFYYIQGGPGDKFKNTWNGNILAVCTDFDDEDLVSINGSDYRRAVFTQVNPDTNTNDNDYVSGFTIEKDTTNSVAGQSLVYKWKISQSDVDGNDYKDNEKNNNSDTMNLTGTFTIAASDIANLAGSEVGITSEPVSNSNSATISTTGAGSNANSSITISGAANGNITIGGTTDNITLSAKNTEYIQTVDTTNNLVSLDNVDSSQNDIGTTTYTGGTTMVVNVASAANSTKDAIVTISHDTVTRTDPPINPNNPIELAFGGTTNVVTGVSSDSEGHITGVTIKPIKMPTETSYAIDGVSADNQGQITVSLNGVETPSGKDLYYVVNGTNVYNQGTIDFYTKREIDNKINAINGMVYKGNIPSTGLPTTGVENGWTYTVPTSSSYGGHSVKAGDLLIATGDEYQDTDPTNTATYVAPNAADHDSKIGKIAGTITWNPIESGNEFDSQYDLSVANNIISLTSNITGDNPDIVTFDGGDKISVSTDNGTITIAHQAPSSVTGTANANLNNQDLNYGQTVSVVNGVKADSYGHVEAIYTSTLTMPSAPSDTKESFSVTASDTKTNGYVILSEDGNNGNDKGQLTFANGTLTTATVTASGDNNKNGTITINHNTITTTHTDNTGEDATPVVISPTTGFNAINAIEVDGKGHLSGYTTSKFTLPEEALVKLSGAADSYNSAVAQVTANTKAKIAFSTMVGTQGYDFTGIRTPAFTLSTSSLKIATTAPTASTIGDIAIDLEWGTF